MNNQVTTCLSYAFDWLREWHQFSVPITEHRNGWKRPQAQENAANQVALGLSLAADWSRGWHEFVIFVNIHFLAISRTSSCDG